MRNYLFLLLLMGSLISAQVKFEQGHYVNSKNEKIEGLIKNEDWLNNPSAITFKSSESADIETINLQNIELFEIYNRSKYVKAYVPIDVSPDAKNAPSKLSNSSEPEYHIKTVLLKVLEEGEVNLYQYRAFEINRLFIRKGEGDYQPLVYKYFIHIDKNSNKQFVKSNEAYKKLLMDELDLDNDQKHKVRTTKFTVDNIQKLIHNYNSKSQGEVQNVTYDNQNSKKINFYAKAGYVMQTVRTSNPNLNPGKLNADGFEAGVEFEFVLPFNQNKWGLFLAPNYFSVKGESVPSKSSWGDEIIYENTMITMPVGLRHYMFVNDDLSLFLQGAFQLNFRINSAYKRMFELATQEIIELEDVRHSTSHGLNLGLGVRYKKLTAQVNTLMGSELLSYHIWGHNVKNFSVSVGYQLF